METRHPLDAEAWSRFHQLASSLLPVTNAEELVEGLASLWCTVTAALRAYVALGETDQGSSLIYRVDADKQRGRIFTPAEISPLSPQSSHDFPALLRQFHDSEAIDESRRQTILITDDTKQLGAVLLVSQNDSALDERLMSELADWSAALIKQLVLLESASAGTLDLTALEQEKLESLAEFAAGAGHEINNPLATISGRVQLLLRDETDYERRRSLATIGGQAYRIRDMIGDLMIFGRPPRPEPQALNLTDILDESVNEMAEELESHHCTLKLDIAENMAIWADRNQLKIVITCLLRNSIEATLHGGSIEISARSIEESNPPLVLFSITDNGSGLSDSDRLHLFDPFYSGRQAGRGLGFGLSKCWRIVTNHGGSIRGDSIPDDKTTFEVSWPAKANPLSKPST